MLLIKNAWFHTQHMELLKIWMSGFIVIILRKLNIIFNIRAVLIIFFLNMWAKIITIKKPKT